jgi:hypothetical protein
VTFKILHFAFVLFGRGSSAERSQVPSFAAARVPLARVKAVLARRDLSDHSKEISSAYAA